MTDKPNDKKKMNDEIVFRIMKLEHLVKDIEDEVITFTHPSCFDDVKEAKDENALFVQCWTKSPETPAMWEIYAPNKQGIMIKQDIAFFNKYNDVNKDLVAEEKLFKSDTFSSEWRKIGYDYKDDPQNNNSIDPREQLFHKRKEYIYEQETRWVVDLRNLSWNPTYKEVGGKYERYPKIIITFSDGCYNRLLQLPFSKLKWSTLISEIIIDPRADDNFFRYATDLLKAKIQNPNLKIKRSTFWGKSDKLKETTNSEILQLYYYSEGRGDLVIQNLRDNTNENLKLRLLALHDLFLFSNQIAIDNNHLINEEEFKIMLKQKGGDVKLYLISYIILLTMSSILKVPIILTLKNITPLQSEILVKQMFFLVGTFLSNEHLISSSENKDFINGITKFWQSEKTRICNTYFNDWKTIYLELQVKINNPLASIRIDKSEMTKKNYSLFLENNLAHASFADIFITLDLKRFFKTITQPYFDSLKEEPKP